MQSIKISRVLVLGSSGVVGHGVSTDLVKNNYEVYFYARKRKIISEVSNIGGIFVPSIEDIPKHTNICITNLPNTRDVKTVVIGKMGLIKNLKKEYKVIDGLGGLGKDTDSEFHLLFYDKIREGWKEFQVLYESFILEVVIPKITLKTNIYQTYPSYRIQYPLSKAITTLHCDSDENHKHPLGEINILIPIIMMLL